MFPADYKILEEIDTGGSVRRFYRCVKGKNTFILIIDKNPQDYLKLQRHLYRCGIGVPKVYEVHQDSIIIEDLGKDSLYTLISKNKKDIEKYYKFAINELIKLQIDGYPGAPLNLYYDYNHIKWEQGYFRQFFLHQLCKMEISNLKVLDNDFVCLAEELIEKSKPMSNFLMHRDYQSQNILIKDGRARIVDFQSARIGPLTYDLVALLRDAYVKIPKKIEMTLVDYYLHNLKKREFKFKKREFLEVYHLSGLQRHMQALGAFANLSLNKNKPQFKQHIPRGLELLKSELKPSKFKNLSRIVNEVAEVAYEKNIY